MVGIWRRYFRKKGKEDSIEPLQRINYICIESLHNQQILKDALDAKEFYRWKISMPERKKPGNSVFLGVNSVTYFIQFRKEKGLRSNRMDWISVKESLPDLYTFVLVCASYNRTGEPKSIAIARIVSEHGIWDLLGFLEVGAASDVEYPIDRHGITHWMPLPDRPEDKS